MADNACLEEEEEEEEGNWGGRQGIEGTKGGSVWRGSGGERGMSSSSSRP